MRVLLQRSDPCGPEDQIYLEAEGIEDHAKLEQFIDHPRVVGAGFGWLGNIEHVTINIADKPRAGEG